MKRQTAQYLSISLFLALVVWGIYSLIYYLGVPVHGAVLLKDGGESLNEFCGGDALLCRGVSTLFSFIWFTLVREPVFVWFGLLSVIIYLCYFVWAYMKRGRWEYTLTMKPWKLLLFFVACLWLIYTCVSNTGTGDVSVRRLVEPLPQVYTSAGPESLAVLQKNYSELTNMGCLKYEKEFGNGAGQYQYKTWCVQMSFFTRVLPVLVFVLLLFFELLILGRLILSFIKLNTLTPLIELSLSLGLGIAGWIILLWLFAILSVYSMPVGWSLAVIVPLVGYRQTLYWFRSFLNTEWSVHQTLKSITVPLVWILFSYLALNFLNIVRPFPIGWDDLGSYVNRPHLLVSYGKFVFSMASFQWEYLTSLGFLLFGFNSWFGATAALAANWAAGVVAILFTYTFARTFLGEYRGVLSALVYYMLPVVGHFSFADMKIDNAVYSMGTLATFLIFLWLFYQRDEEEVREPLPLTWLVLAGFFAGLAFGMKVTGIMIIMTLGVILVGASWHVLAGVGAVFLSFGVFAAQGALKIPEIVARVGAPAFLTDASFAIICVVVGLLFFGGAVFMKKSKTLPSIIAGAVFVGGVALAIFPWMQHNVFFVGDVVPRMMLEIPNTLSPAFDLDGKYGDDMRPVRRLPPELQLDKSNAACKPSGGKEELGRYWGFREGWGHYITLPWRTVMNIDSAGYYVTTMPALLLFPLLLLFPFFWFKAGRWVRWLWVGTAVLVVQWMFMANGVPWYGIGMFMGLSILTEVIVAKSPDLPNRLLASLLIGLSLLMCLGQRLWQFDQQRNLFEYAIGKISAEALRERTIPYYDDITDIVMERNATMPATPYVYRVGTFIPYFVPRNLEVIGIADHQLDFFNCLYQEKDPQLTLKRLKALGFNSIIFDTNTATIEKDPLGSLHQKVNAFTSFLNNPDIGFRVVFNDTNAGIAFLLFP